MKIYLPHTILLLTILFFSCHSPVSHPAADSASARNLVADTSKKDNLPQINIPVVTPPVIEKKGDHCTLILPDEIRKAIHNYDSTFQIWETRDFVKSCDGNYNYYSCSEHQVQYAVVGKFNDDSAPDVALLGHNKKYSYLLGIVSSGQTYRVMEIQKWPVAFPGSTWIDNENNKGLWEYLLYYHPDNSIPQKTRTLYSHDGFLKAVYGKGSTIYWMQNDKFKSAVYGD